jgi:hypothetical protein
MSLCVAAMEKPTGMIVKQNAQVLLTIQKVPANKKKTAIKRPLLINFFRSSAPPNHYDNWP